MRGGKDEGTQFDLKISRLDKLIKIIIITVSMYSQYVSLSLSPSLHPPPYCSLHLLLINVFNFEGHT